MSRARRPSGGIPSLWRTWREVGDPARGDASVQDVQRVVLIPPVPALAVIDLVVDGHLAPPGLATANSEPYNIKAPRQGVRVPLIQPAHLALPGPATCPDLAAIRAVAVPQGRSAFGTGSGVTLRPRPNQQWKGALPRTDLVKASGVGITRQDALGSVRGSTDRTDQVTFTGHCRNRAIQAQCRPTPAAKNVRPCRTTGAQAGRHRYAAPRSAMRGRRPRTANRAGSRRRESSSSQRSWDNSFSARALRVARHLSVCNPPPGDGSGRAIRRRPP